MSRPNSSKGKKKVEKKITPKKQIEILTATNSELLSELENLKIAHDELIFKMAAITQTIFNGVDRSDLGVALNIEPKAVNTDLLMKLVNKLCVKKTLYDQSVESRTAELESRVTEISLQVAKLSKKTLAYEQGLEDILDCEDLEEVKDKVYNLQLVAGQKYHELDVAELSQNFAPEESLQEVFTKDQNIMSFTDLHSNSNSLESDGQLTNQVLDSALQLNLKQSNKEKRKPGDSSINDMDDNLKLFLQQELSREKLSGADWRMFADRVGIKQETIKYWRSLNLICPMARVFKEWGKSSNATVRLLHRHLMSPPMRCTLLAKYISDVYNVN